MPNQVDMSVLRGRSRMNSHAQISLSGGDYTVPVDYAMYGSIEFIGNIGSSAFNVKLPAGADGHVWLIYNHTTGSGAMTVITTAAGSTGVGIAPGSIIPVWSDSVNVLAWSAGALGSISATTAVSAGLSPLPPAGYGVSNTSNPGAGYMILEVPVSTFATWDLAGDVNAWTTAIVFTGASQDFTAHLPLSGTHPWWYVWNDTDFVATLAPPTGTGGAVNSTLPPRSSGVLSMVSELGGTVAARLYGTTAAFAGTAHVTIPSANTYTLSVTEEAAQYLRLTGGNQNASVFFRNSPTNAGRTWMFQNQTAFLMTVKGSAEAGLGVALAAGAAALITVGDDAKAKTIGPMWVPGNDSLPPAPILSALTWSGNTATVTWSNLQTQILDFQGGSATDTVTATWPATGTGLTAGQAWLAHNSTGQLLKLLANGSSAPVYLQNGDRAWLFFDGADLQRAWDGVLQGHSGNGANANGSNLVVAGGQSTGFGTGGELHFQIGTTASSGSQVNPLADKLVLVDSNGTLLRMHAGTSDVLQVQCIEAADGTHTLRSLPGIYYRGYYWTGSTSQFVDVGTDLNVASTAPHYQYRIITAGNPRLKVGEAGQVILAGTTMAADADLNAGDMALALDPTNGASKLLIKAKSLNGVVVTGSISLA